MNITVTAPTTVFLYSLLLGIGLAAVYEFIRMLRAAGLKQTYAIIITDILFLCFAGFCTFIFALGFLNGKVRFFILLGEIVSFVIFRYTVGELLSHVYSKIFKILTIILLFVTKKIKKLLKKLLQFVLVPLYNISEHKRLKKEKKGLVNDKHKRTRVSKSRAGKHKEKKAPNP